MSGYPFKIIPDNKALYSWQWNDDGSGSVNWATFCAGYQEPGWAQIGDAVVNGTEGGNNTKFPSGINMLMVATDNPLIAKPATRYRPVLTIMTGSGGSLRIWKPDCEDENYIALGYVARSGHVPGEPGAGQYYCVNKAFVKQRTGFDTIIPGNDGATLYMTISGTRHFSTKNEGFELIAFADIKKYCTTSPSDLYPMSRCGEFMPTLCTVDDINGNFMTENSYVCQTWASRDTLPYPSTVTDANPMKLSASDKIKYDYCQKNPNDRICDCIKADFRTGYNADVLKYPTGTSRACLSSLCRNRADGYKPFLLNQDILDQKSCPEPKSTYRPPPTTTPPTMPPPGLPPTMPPPGLPPTMPPGQPPTYESNAVITPGTQPSSSNTTLYIVLAFVALIIFVLIVRRKKKSVAVPPAAPKSVAVN